MRASGDPVWTADGVVSDRWLPVSPNGRLDGFEWKLPLAEIGVSPPGDRGLAAAAEAARGDRRRAARDPSPSKPATPVPEPVAAEPAAGASPHDLPRGPKRPSR